MGGGPDRFRPHVSLVYGRRDEDRRAAPAARVERALEPPLIVNATGLEVWETRGAVSAWRLYGRFALPAGTVGGRRHIM